MKKTTIHTCAIWMLVLVTGLTSCNKWLDVKPKAQLAEDDMFATSQGYQDVLAGVYTRAAKRDLYGENLSVGFLEVIARRYANITTNNFHGFYNSAFHNYTSTESANRINFIWSEAYAGIAQLNLLLKHVDASKGVFATENDWRRAKGEALGLRAYLHFDLVRMFAPAFTVDAAYKGIPYMKDFTVKPSASLSTTDVLDSCISDLKAAEELLSNNTSSSTYYFNVIAAKATLARLYLYKNDKVNALSYAKQVINFKQQRFATSAEINATAPDRTLPSEVIFGMSSFDLYTVSETYFSETANGAVIPNYVYLQVPEANINTLYETASQGFGGDPRYKLWWQVRPGQSLRFLSKYWNIGTAVQYRVPLIRLGEMYLIAAETDADLESAKTWFNTFRVSGRFLPATTATTRELLDNDIAKEYAKELFGEGQQFYWYKRKNITVPGATVSGNALFVLPVPQNEIEFR